VLATPDIVWEPSAPSGPLETDPYVQAARASNLAWVLASNARDFTIEQLTDTTTAHQIEQWFLRFLQTRGESDPEAIAIPGPIPTTPISVTKHADGKGADVLMCDLSGEWYVSEDHPEPVTDGFIPTSITFVVIDEDGVLKVDELSGGEGECDGSDVSIGRFDPAPEPSSGDVRAPLAAND
jgi:hypothetical protein